MKTKTRNIIIGSVIGLIVIVVIVGIFIIISKSPDNPTPKEQCNEVGMLCGNGRVCNPNKICTNCSIDGDCNKKQSGYICSGARCINHSNETRQQVIDEFQLNCSDLTTSTTKEKVNICFIDQDRTPASQPETIPVKSSTGNITGMKCYSSDISKYPYYSKSLGREIDDMTINNPPGAVSQDGKVFYPASDQGSIVWTKQSDAQVVCPVLDSISFLSYNNFYFYSSPTDKPLIKDMSKLNLNPKTISSSNSGIVSSLWNVAPDKEHPSTQDVTYHTNLTTPDSYKQLYSDGIKSPVDANYERVCISPIDGMCQLFTTGNLVLSAPIITYNPNNKATNHGLTWILSDSDKATIGAVFNCCMSYDGTYQAIDTVNGIYLSSDKGSSFRHIPFKSGTTTSGDEKYLGISISYDGKVIYTQRGSSYYYSNNYGKDFTMIASIAGMSNFALTHDGNTIYNVCNDPKTKTAQLYRAIRPPPESLSRLTSVDESPDFKPISSVIPDKSAFTDVQRIKCSPSGKLVVVSGTVNGKEVTYVSSNGDSSSPIFSLLA